MWVNVFKNEPSKICRRETLTSLDPYNVAINKAWEQRDKVLENYRSEYCQKVGTATIIT